MVTAQPAPDRAVVLAALAAALLVIGLPWSWRIARHTLTIAHEGSHALAALATGRQLAGIRVHSDTSGLTVSRGRPNGPGMILTALAGYVGPAVVGLGGAFLLGLGHALAVLWLAVVLLALILLQIRNFYGLYAVLVAGLSVFAISWWGSADVQSFAAYAGVWFCSWRPTRRPRAATPASARSGRLVRRGCPGPTDSPAGGALGGLLPVGHPRLSPDRWTAAAHDMRSGGSAGPRPAGARGPRCSADSRPPCGSSSCSGCVPARAAACGVRTCRMAAFIRTAARNGTGRPGVFRSTAIALRMRSPLARPHGWADPAGSRRTQCTSSSRSPMLPGPYPGVAQPAGWRLHRSRGCCLHLRHDQADTRRSRRSTHTRGTAAIPSAARRPTRRGKRLPDGASSGPDRTRQRQRTAQSRPVGCRCVFDPICSHEVWSDAPLARQAAQGARGRVLGPIDLASLVTSRTPRA